MGLILPTMEIRGPRLREVKKVPKPKQLVNPFDSDALALNKFFSFPLQSPNIESNNMITSSGMAKSFCYIIYLYYYILIIIHYIYYHYIINNNYY